MSISAIRDVTILSPEKIWLENWTLSAEHFTNRTAKGDLWSDLQGVIGDPLYDRNFILQTPIVNRTWTYETWLPQAGLLVLEGVQMGAYVWFQNETLLGTVNDQFLRYEFPIPRPGRLQLVWDASIDTDGRYSACAGGWDWAPYSKLRDVRGFRKGNQGLVRPSYLIPEGVPYIRYVQPLVYYDGSLPTRRITQGNFVVRVHIDASQTVCVQGNWKGSERVCTTPKDTVSLSAPNVTLWWPNGLGTPTLYELEISLGEQSWTQTIGFRVAALVTANDTNSTDGSGTHGMHFRINGVDLLARGANVVPMDLLPARWTEEAHFGMVASAAAVGMNLLRVWGGGVVLPTAFYDACDRMGILLYHDLMFVEEDGHGAVATETVRREIEHIVRSLGRHTSIVLWSGCNECSDGTMGVYESFVMPTLAAVDDSRAIWPGSPSPYGWESGVHTVDGRPNGKRLKIATARSHVIERHGPYHRGYSLTFPTVNGVLDPTTYDTDLPPVLSNATETRRQPGCFVSEFGASVFSSAESMTRHLRPEDWGLHASGDPDTCTNVVENLNECTGNNSMAERNYACDSMIQSYFGKQDFDATGLDSFRRLLYLCMLSQMLWMKSRIEILRSDNTMGLLIWQLNEVWPTGGWGLLEYHYDSVASQGGDWKPLMYLLRDMLFQDVMVACGRGNRCFLRNDSDEDIEALVSCQAWSADASTHELWQERIPVTSRNAASFSLPHAFTQSADVVVLELMDTDEHRFFHRTSFMPKVPADVEWTVSVEVTLVRTATTQAGVVFELELSAIGGVAIYVACYSTVPGVFEPAFVHVLSPTDDPTIVEFRASRTTQREDLLKGLYVQHMSGISYLTDRFLVFSDN